MSGHLLPNLDDPIPLFPLPNLVMFPRAVQFLHLFEPRYKLMFQDLKRLEADRRLIAMAHLLPGYQAKYHTHHAAIHPVLCLTLVVRYEILENGRFNLLIRGLCRARVQKETHDRAYRRAWLEGIDESSLGVESPESQGLRDGLRRVLQAPAFGQMDGGRFCRELFESDLELGDLADMLAFYLLPGETLEAKQLMLNELNVLERAAILLKELESLRRRFDSSSTRGNRWPPPSSAN